MEVKKRIFVAVLNWGLGHATRSVPLIRELLLQGAEPVIGSDGDAAIFLKSVFPELQFINMPSYNVRYENSNMYINMAKQLPNLCLTLTRERSFIKEIINKHNIKGIISDNRYASSSNKVPSVFIGHQLNIKISNILVSKSVNYLNWIFLSKFDKVWVPDVDGESSLSGELSRGFIHKDLSYIGPLSRLNADILPDSTYKIVAVLSGPEPQRTNFERILTSKLKLLDIPSLLIRGILKKGDEQKTGQLTVKNFANGDELVSLIKGAELYIARSGFSTLMDLAKAGSGPLLLVPTPGQTEQEYLANSLMDLGAALVQQQEKIDIQDAWNKRKTVSGLSTKFGESKLSSVVSDFLAAIK